MGGNAEFRHTNTAVVSIVGVEAPLVVTSAELDERLADVYDRTGVRAGILEDVAGIVERRWWPTDVTFTEAAARAGERAIEEAGIDRADIGVIIDTSVCRGRLEPSSACEVHHLLGLGSATMNFDVSNACLGFVNAMHLTGTMIDAGVIDYALIVDGEGSRFTQEATIARLLDGAATAADVVAEFATLTLGSGATAAVMGPADRHPGTLRVVAGVHRSATEHHGLCVGDLDRMTTDTAGLLDAGLDLAEAMWNDSRDVFEWGALDLYVCHQISMVHTTLMGKRLGIDLDLVPMTFPQFGNIGPSAVPFTLARNLDRLGEGSRALCMGIGSGLNASLLELAR